jgi:hypothetical protein
MIPEALIATEIGPRVLVGLRYRFVAQTSASFYEPAYPEVRSLMSGDARLGTLKEHAGAIALRGVPLGRPGDFGSLAVAFEQEVSRLRYERLPGSPAIVASVSSVGVMWLY